MLLWALWMTLVVILNVLDAFKMSGKLSATWKFASGNFWYIGQVTKIYSTPAWINWVMFVGVIVWEVVAGFLLWQALLTFDGSSYRIVNLAFLINLALWGAFIVMDELFQAWAAEIGGSNPMDSHRSIFTTFLICLVALHALPNG